MSYVTPEEVSRAREMDLLTYLRCYEPQELVKASAGEYSTRTHDSVKISNGKWYRFATNEGGRSALDYLIKVEGIPFIQAVQKINGQDVITRPASFNKQKRPKDENRKLLLPPKADSNAKATAYLLSRGVDREIIDYCITNDLIYESLPKHALVFIGYDGDHVPRYAGYRGLCKSRIMGDCSGSSKEYSFRIIRPGSHKLHVFESAIDLMSFASLTKLQGGDWKKDSYISMAGVFAPSRPIIPKSLARYLEDADVHKILIHFDNDTAGTSAAQSLAAALESKYEVGIYPPPEGKDYNDYLRIKRGERL